MTPEGEILKSCTDYLTLRGIPFVRNNTGAVRIHRPNGSEGFVRFGQTGSSDLLICLPPRGHFMAAECKTRTGRLSPAQKNYLDSIRQSGGIVVVVRSLDDLIEAIKENK